MAFRMRRSGVPFALLASRALANSALFQIPYGSIRHVLLLLQEQNFSAGLNAQNVSPGVTRGQSQDSSISELFCFVPLAILQGER
ncbi:hypothetical protein Krac_11523 [Ktedonobacter racemifer DSM 44963]|uniref:Uncharacterized protein n=1 Tax=Ktedonobacter racemifer DSM 44963 TaxID=485913 RepID=D6TCB7_KTERA|nr:hypothetical protein Krac_11523 [Ktedonobacter racemifer DSM 44963]